MADKKPLRALTGISVYDEEDNEVKRYEAGDKIEDLDENDLASEIRAGKVEEWVAYQTDNVQTDEGVEVTGVRARHSGGNVVIKEVEE